VYALKNVNLEINSGEFVSIMGPSGCGKSTLLHVMGCLDKPTKGKVIINGRDVSKLSDEELARIRNRYIGFVFQSFFLLPVLSALENVMIPGMISGNIDEEKARKLLEFVGLKKRENHLPSQLSGGERQRVAIARALINDPKIILADEPTGNLDSKSGRDVLRLLSRLNRSGVTVVVVTHDESVAERAERVIYMKDGKIIGEKA